MRALRGYGDVEMNAALPAFGSGTGWNTSRG